MPAAKLTATCAYCLRPDTRLAPGTCVPVRHGWKAHGTTGGGANGQLGSWHSGPCHGISYPHLGASTEGLLAAISDCERVIATRTAHLAALDGRPVLPYYRRDHNRKGAPVIETIEVQPGAMSPSPLSGLSYHPEYETLLASARRDRTAMLEAAGQGLVGLRMALAAWQPAEPQEVK